MAGPTRLSGTILCIEDDPVSMELVEAALLGYPGVQLLKAFNGQDGVRRALEEHPDLVLLDMHLPDMGGLGVVRLLNETISQTQLRVVLLTSEPFSIEVVKAMSLGAREYWPKPLDLSRLAGALARALAAPEPAGQRRRM